MILVFDVGATKTRLALSKDGSIFDRVESFTTDKSRHGLQYMLKQMQKLVGLQRISVIVGGFPGQIDSHTGIIGGVMNMTDWNGLVVRRPIEKMFGCPVWLKNDVALGGLGEAWHGAGSHEGIMVYFTVSTGVNAVRIIDGRIDETITRYDVGQELIPDPDGGLVTLESLVSGAAFKVKHGVTPDNVHDGRVWRAEEHHLARGVYNTLIHWTPELVVFGGSMMRDIVVDKVDEELRRLPQVGSWPKLTKAKLGDKAGLYGALALLRQIA